MQTASTNDVSLSNEDKTFLPKQNQTRLAIKDILEGTQKWRIWFMLAYQDIKLRYRRSVLGPFWITISMAITVYSMGYLYGHLFRSNLQTYYPFLVAGMLSWSLISGIIVEFSDAFITYTRLITQIKLPYTLYIHRVATRNMLVFFHNIVVIIPILIIYHETVKINLNTLLLIPGLLVIYMNAMSYGSILAMMCARYRDVAPIVKNLVQVAFFLTPVMWNPAILPEKGRLLVLLNPFYSFVELVRAPIIGTHPSLPVVGIAIMVTLMGISIAFLMFRKYRARIVYWL